MVINEVQSPNILLQLSPSNAELAEASCLKMNSWFKAVRMWLVGKKKKGWGGCVGRKNGLTLEQKLSNIFDSGSSG